MSNPPHILFVDDEPRVLRGLRRQLRTLLAESGNTEPWQMSFAASGPEALNLLQTGPIDLVITDMRMPGMDGVTLLQTIIKNHPQVIRFVLSGQANQERTLFTTNLAHQFLAKPCSAATLKTAIENALQLHNLLQNDNLKTRMSQLGTLPSLPTVYQALIAEIQSMDGSLQRVGKIVAQDMGMTAKILQLVNSAFFGLRREVRDPVQAVILLGLDTIKALVLSLHIFSQYSGLKIGHTPVDVFQAHSLRVGRLAREIANQEQVEPQMIDDAFTAGLLHDVGKLVLAANLPQEYHNVVLLIKQGVDILEAERQILGTTHAEVGAYLLGLWGLPHPIVETVAYHHQPAPRAIPEFNALIAVHAANVWDYNIDTSDSNNDHHLSLDTTYIAEIGLTERMPIWQSACKKILEGDAL